MNLFKLFYISNPHQSGSHIEKIYKLSRNFRDLLQSLEGSQTETFFEISKFWNLIELFHFAPQSPLLEFYEWFICYFPGPNELAQQDLRNILVMIPLQPPDLQNDPSVFMAANANPFNPPIIPPKYEQEDDSIVPPIGGFPYSVEQLFDPNSQAWNLVCTLVMGFLLRGDTESIVELLGRLLLVKRGGFDAASRDNQTAPNDLIESIAPQFTQLLIQRPLYPWEPNNQNPIIVDSHPYHNTTHTTTHNTTHTTTHTTSIEADPAARIELFQAWQENCRILQQSAQLCLQQQDTNNNNNPSLTSQRHVIKLMMDCLKLLRGQVEGITQGVKMWVRWCFQRGFFHASQQHGIYLNNEAELMWLHILVARVLFTPTYFMDTNAKFPGKFPVNALRERAVTFFKREGDVARDPHVTPLSAHHQPSSKWADTGVGLMLVKPHEAFYKFMAVLLGHVDTFQFQSQMFFQPPHFTKEEEEEEEQQQHHVTSSLLDPTESRDVTLSSSSWAAPWFALHFSQFLMSVQVITKERRSEIMLEALTHFHTLYVARDSQGVLSRDSQGVLSRDSGEKIPFFQIFAFYFLCAGEEGKNLLEHYIDREWIYDEKQVGEFQRIFEEFPSIRESFFSVGKKIARFYMKKNQSEESWAEGMKWSIRAHDWQGLQGRLDKEIFAEFSDLVVGKIRGVFPVIVKTLQKEKDFELGEEKKFLIFILHQFANFSRQLMEKKLSRAPPILQEFTNCILQALRNKSLPFYLRPHLLYDLFQVVGLAEKQSELKGTEKRAINSSNAHPYLDYIRSHVTVPIGVADAELVLHNLHYFEQNRWRDFPLAEPHRVYVQKFVTLLENSLKNSPVNIFSRAVLEPPLKICL